MNNITNQAKVQQAVQAVGELTRCAQAIDVAFIHLGEMLWFVKKNELYKYYSEHTQTMSAFLREIDIGIKTSQADHYIRIYKTFGEHLEGRQIAFKRLLMIHPLVTDIASIGPLLELAQNLPIRALADEIKERQGRTPSDACEHPPEAIQTHFRCSICGCWLKG